MLVVVLTIATAPVINTKDVEEVIDLVDTVVVVTVKEVVVKVVMVVRKKRWRWLLIKDNVVILKTNCDGV